MGRRVVFLGRQGVFSVGHLKPQMPSINHIPHSIEIESIKIYAIDETLTSDIFKILKFFLAAAKA